MMQGFVSIGFRARKNIKTQTSMAGQACAGMSNQEAGNTLESPLSLNKQVCEIQSNGFCAPQLIA